jgi:hypothetical protein
MDLGCGSGAWLYRLWENGYQDLTGIDCNTEGRCIPKGRYIWADLDSTEWGLDNDKYEL